MSTPRKKQTRRRRVGFWGWLARIVLVLTLIATLIGIIQLGIIGYQHFCSSDKPQPTLPSSATFGPEKIIPVPANMLWDDTGITVKKGDWIKFSASGSWWNGLSTTGPDGDGGFFCGIGRRDCGTCPVTNGNLGELVGKVGDGLPFRIGDSAVQAVDQDGSLFLSMNENTGPCIDGRMGSCYDDNNGALQVTVSIGSINGS